MRRSRLYLYASFCVLVLLSFPVTSRAQSASVGGVIRDPSEAFVGQAKVSLQNTQTGITRGVSTNDEGIFWFTNVPPGAYAITVEKAGFKTINIPDLTLTVNQSFTFEAHLELGALATTTVVKAADLPPIDLDNATISNLVDSRRMLDLPLLTRDAYSLILLSPGVSQSISPGLGGFSTNGNSERSNDFLLDGVDNNDTDVPGAPKGLNAINPDSAQEFRVMTSNYSAEFGRNTGAVIQILTRSGTNELHGDAYWFGRYSALGARDFFNHQPDTPKNPYTRNDFGGSVGGPIVKDKLFWFANYEGQRFITNLTNTSTVPTSDFKTGKFTATVPDPENPSSFIDVPIDVSNPENNALGLPLDPTIQSLLSYYPAPNGPAVVPGMTGLLFYPSESRWDGNNATAKVDYHITQKHSLSVRYSFTQASDPNFDHSDFLPNSLGGTELYLRNQSAGISLTSAFSDRWINEFRFGANRSHQEYTCNGYKTIDSLGQIDPVGVGADYVMPFSGFGCFTLIDANQQARFTGTYQTIDNISYSRGRHLFKFGGEFRDVYSNSFDNFSTRTNLNFVSYSFAGVAALFPDSPASGYAPVEDSLDALLGVENSQFQTQYFDKNNNRASSDLRGLRQREWAGFVQDTWKVLPNLTLNYGLRYEYYGVPFEVNNNLSNLFADPSGPAPFTFTIVGPGTGHTLYANQYNNIEPRIGLAWDPFKDGKTSVRAGYGIFHDRAYGNLLGNSRGNAPFSLSYQDFSILALSDVAPPDTIQNPEPLVVPDECFCAAYLIDPKLKSPYTQAWNFGIQRAITPTIILEVNYVGNKGTHLFRAVDGNPPQPNLVADLLAYCVPGNDFGCDTTTLQFGSLWAGADFYFDSPFNAVNNNAFYTALGAPGPGAVLYKSIGNSNYNALQVNLQKHFSSGFQFQLAYTYAHAISDVNDPLVPSGNNGYLPRNTFDLRAERGNSDFDIRHRAVVNFVYQPNIGKGRGHLSEGFVGRVLEGWALSGIIDAQTGHPFDIYGLTDANHTGEVARASQTGGPTAQPKGTDKTFTGPSAASIYTTPFDVQANTGKNEFYGPGAYNIDIATLKDTALTEKLKLQFRFEVYNLFNHAQFAQPYNIYYPGNDIFSQSTSTVTRADGTTSARQMQFGLKLIF